MCGECVRCLGCTGFALVTVCVLSRSTLLSLQGELSKADPGFRALPRSRLLRFRFSGTPQRRRLGWAWVSCPSQVWAAQVTRCLASTLSPGGQCILITSLVPAIWFPGCTMRAPSQVCCVSPLGIDLWLRPSWQMSTAQDPRKTWVATESLLTVWWRMLSLGLRLPLDFWLWLSPTCLSASSRGMGWSAAGQLSFSIHSILCSVSGPGCAFG